MKVRPSVRRFAELMEKQLRANDFQDGWAGMQYPYFLAKLCSKMAELVGSMEVKKQKGRHDPTQDLFLGRHHLELAAEILEVSCGDFVVPAKKKETAKLAADAANYAHMIFDNLSEDS